LPAGARYLAIKLRAKPLIEAGILNETAVRLIPARRDNMQPHAGFLMKSSSGFELKVLASMIALACTIQRISLASDETIHK
jgi:hypothetical protein